MGIRVIDYHGWISEPRHTSYNDISNRSSNYFVTEDDEIKTSFSLHPSDTELLIKIGIFDQKEEMRQLEIFFYIVLYKLLINIGKHFANETAQPNMTSRQSSSSLLYLCTEFVFCTDFGFNHPTVCK